MDELGLPDNEYVGLRHEDREFLEGYVRGDVSKEEFVARYGQPDGTIAIPVFIVGVPKQKEDDHG